MSSGHQAERLRLNDRSICANAAQITTLQTSLLPAIAIALAVSAPRLAKLRTRLGMAPSSSVLKRIGKRLLELAAFAHDLAHVFGLLVLDRQRPIDAYCGAPFRCAGGFLRRRKMSKPLNILNLSTAKKSPRLCQMI